MTDAATPSESSEGHGFSDKCRAVFGTSNPCATTWGPKKRSLYLLSSAWLVLAELAVAA